MRAAPPGLDTRAARRAGRRGRRGRRCRRTRGWPTRTRRELRTHDRFGRRIDQVEFHPELPRADGARAAPRPARHAVVARAGQRTSSAPPAFMLFTEAEPSVLCPVSMSYAVTPALRANAALHAAWAPQARQHAPTTRASCPSTQQDARVTMGMGMTEKQGGSDVRANTTRADARRRGRLGPALHASPATSGSSRRRCATPSWCWRRPPAACSCLLPAALPARRQRQRHRASSA
ncbi:MAG: hypothetical protein MZW92_56185 [Comamonadaceae bacterium]|nr:hypothetical protein [Comamonadaceae bacterium]